MELYHFQSAGGNSINDVIIAVIDTGFFLELLLSTAIFYLLRSDNKRPFCPDRLLAAKPIENPHLDPINTRKIPENKIRFLIMRKCHRNPFKCALI